MNANTAYVIIAVALATLIAIVFTTVWALNARDKSRSADRRAERELAEREWKENKIIPKTVMP
jgi:signal transduction histidine kinase